MKLKVAIIHKFGPGNPYEVEEKHLQALLAVEPEISFTIARSEDELIETCPDADILICWGIFTPIRWCRGAKSLKWIQSVSAGVDALMPIKAEFPNLIITKGSGIHGIPMAEYVVLYMLMIAKRIPFIMANQPKAEWKKPKDPIPFEIEGKTVGIVGMGEIGSIVAKKCKAMGLTVYGYKRTAAQYDCLDKLYLDGQLNDMLASCDFVVSLLPDTAATRNFFNAERFSAMRDGAYFISLGRGKAVDEDALLAALDGGHVAGAAMDVFQVEPLPSDSPIWQHPGIIVTPHITGMTPYYFDRAFASTADNLKKYLAGKLKDEM